MNWRERMALDIAQLKRDKLAYRKGPAGEHLAVARGIEVAFGGGGGGAETDPVATAALTDHASEDRSDNVHGLDDVADNLEALIAGKQPLATLLTNIAALSTVADRGLYFTGADTPALFTLTAFARTLLDDADAAAARSTLELSGSSLADVGTPASTDRVLLQDDSDSGNLKTADFSAFGGGGGGSGISVVSSPPSTPATGDEIYYQLSGGGFWHLYFDGTDWQFLGGPSLHAEVTTDQSTASGSFTDLATVGPSVAVPLDGDYLVEYAARVFNGTASVTSYMSLSGGGLSPSSTDAYEGVNNSGFASGPRSTPKSLTAGTVTAKYAVSSPSTGNWKYRWLRVTPVRIDG